MRYTNQCPVCGKNKLKTRKVAEGWIRQECSACLFLNDIREPRKIPPE